MSDSDGQRRVRVASEAREQLEDISRELAYKAESASAMGMSGLADALYTLAAGVRTNAAKLHRCWSEEFRAWCVSVEQGSTNMLRATLAGCKLGDRSAKPADVRPPSPKEVP